MVQGRTNGDHDHANDCNYYHLGHFLIDTLLQDPDAICQIDAATGQEETRRSVLMRTRQLAKCLRAMGLKPGDVLALGGHNHLDLCIPHFAALLNGYPVTGVDPCFKYDEIKNLFKLVEPKIAFCQSESFKDYQRAAAELGLDTRVVAFDGAEHTMAELVQHCDGAPVDDFEVAEFDTDKVFAWLVSTSGSTGLPKVAAMKHQAVLTVLKAFKIYAGPKLLIALHLSAVQWLSGYVAALNMTATNNVRMQTSAPATVEHVIDIINQYRISSAILRARVIKSSAEIDKLGLSTTKPPATMMSAPSILLRILKHELPCDLSCFNSVVLAGASVYKSFLVDLRAALRPDAVVVEAYGQTETLGLVLRPTPLGPLGNCGQEMPPIQVKLVDPVTGETITEPNVPGELWSKGGPQFTEYYKNPEETAKAFSPEGWYRSGDLLRRDEEGYYFFLERLKMLIKYRSYHVIPIELEDLISSLEGVQEVCVTSIPNEVDGEWPVAVVVRTPGSKVSAQEIKDLVADRLSVHKQLRGGVLFVDQLPMTSTGKVARVKAKLLVDGAQLE